MKNLSLAVLASVMLLALSAFAQTAPGMAGDTQSGNLQEMFVRWMPIASVLTATFTFCILLFVASAVRKLDGIHQELKKASQK